MIRHVVETVVLPVAACAPDAEVVAVGDVHGHDELLRDLLEEAGATPAPAGGRTLVLLGDLIDRGPRSVPCLDLALDAKAIARADATVALCGNHEQMLRCAMARHLDMSRREDAYGCWLANGGGGVIRELGLDPLDGPERVREALGPDRVAFLDGMASHLALGQALFVHAGVDPGAPLDDFLATPWDNLLADDFSEEGHWAWIRFGFLGHATTDGYHGRFVVHGHTIDDGARASVAEVASGWRLNLDPGSYATGMARMVRIVGDHATVTTACTVGSSRADRYFHLRGPGSTS